MSANSSESTQSPPAYNSVEFNNSIAVEPMRQPIILAQRALLSPRVPSSSPVPGHPSSTGHRLQNQQQIGYSDASMIEIARNLAAIGHGDMNQIRATSQPLETDVNNTDNKEHNTQPTTRSEITESTSSPADDNTQETIYHNNNSSQAVDPGSDLDTNCPCNTAATSACHCDTDFSRKPVDIPPSVVETDDGLDNLGFLPDDDAGGGYASDSSSSLGSEPRVIDDSSSDSASIFMNSMSFHRRSMYMRDTSDSSDDGNDDEDDDVADTYNLTPIDIQELQEEMTAVGSQRRQHAECDTSSV